MIQWNDAETLFRKRMVLAVRMLSLDDNLTLPLIMSLYIGSPASVDNTGQGMATTILTTLEEFGFDRAIVKSSMSGGCYDGQLLVCKVKTDLKLGKFRYNVK